VGRGESPQEGVNNFPCSDSACVLTTSLGTDSAKAELSKLFLESLRYGMHRIEGYSTITDQLRLSLLHVIPLVVGSYVTISSMSLLSTRQHKHSKQYACFCFSWKDTLTYP